MDFSLMNLMHSCRCCLRCPPEKDLTTPYIYQGKTEIYSHMLEECFKMPLVLGGSGSSGICSVCVDRLRDALNFKMQVEWCQAELQEWLQRDSDGDEAEMDMYSPSRPIQERRSPSRALIRSRSRSPVTSRGHVRSPLPSWSNRTRSRSRSQLRIRPRSRPRSQIRIRPRSQPRHSRSSSRSRVTSPSRITSRSSRVTGYSRPSDRSRVSSPSKASRRKRHSRSSSREIKRRRSRSHSTSRAGPRSSQESRLRSQGSHRSPSLQSEKRREAEQWKPIEDMIPTQSDSNALTARNDSVDREGNEQNVPEFDPTNKEQNITLWLRKVNVCAAINGWSEKQLIHNALLKLKGLAQMWYEGLPSVLFSWTEWQAKLLAAFPPKENYGQMLLAMISRRAQPGDSLEDYYYDKVALINRVSEPITGRLAVECVLHGIDDLSIRLGAEAAQFCDLDNLLSYLRNVQPVSNCKVNNTTQGLNAQPTVSKPDIKCFNCKQKGHSPAQCHLPIRKCAKCQKVGHLAKHCFANIQNSESLEMGGVSFQPFRGNTTRLRCCRNCKELGHNSEQCPLPINKCTKCQKVGHLAAQCYTDVQNNSRDMDGVSKKIHKKIKCFNCHQDGHTLAKCTMPIIQCNRCQKVGHVADQCYVDLQNNSLEDLEFDDESLEPYIDNTEVEKSRQCHKCKQFGHIAIQCKKIKCFNCHQDGHTLAKCTMPIIKCNRCQKVGHVADQCYADLQNNSLEDLEFDDESLEPYIDNTEVEKSRQCHKCKQFGHIANQCKKIKCFNCHQDGHTLAKCTMPIIKCNRCEKVGHVADQCYADLQNNSLEDLEFDDESLEPYIDNTEVEKSRQCHKCKQFGHIAIQCKKIKCFNCHQDGHTLAKCTMPIIKCNRCRKVGHVADQCYADLQNNSLEDLEFDDESLEPYIDNTEVEKSRQCHKCKQFGHIANQCKKIKCFNCHQDGHTLAKCTMPIIKCNRCEKVGHVADQCYADLKNNSLEDLEFDDESLEPYIDNTEVEKSRQCHKCKQLGHIASQCTVIIKKCTVCLKTGHVAEKCFINIRKFRNNTLKALAEVDGASSEPNIEKKPKWCHNCKKKGHHHAKCPLPTKQCSICSYLGHEAETCLRKPTS